MTTPTPHTALPPVLYHYTTAAGLLGILDPSWPKDLIEPPTDAGSALLHATDVRYMNDSVELRFGADLMIDRLRAAARQSDSFAEAFDQLADQLMPSLFDEANRHLRVFAACFCDDGDLLSQWRGYGGGIGGFAIGFRTDVLANHSVSLSGRPGGFMHASQLGLQPVIYGTDAATLAIDQHLLDLREGRGLVVIGRNGKPAVEWLLGGVYRLLARIKHGAFAEEREWRVIDLVNQPEFVLNIPVKARASGLVPYLRFGLNLPEISGDGRVRPVPTALDNIVVGPGSEQRAQVWAVVDFLMSMGHPQIEIRESGAPYRG